MFVSFFDPHFHQAISSLSIDLDSLGQTGGKNYLKNDGTRKIIVHY